MVLSKEDLIHFHSNVICFVTENRNKEKAERVEWKKTEYYKRNVEGENWKNMNKINFKLRRT